MINLRCSLRHIISLTLSAGIFSNNSTCHDLGASLFIIHFGANLYMFNISVCPKMAIKLTNGLHGFKTPRLDCISEKVLRNIDWGFWFVLEIILFSRFLHIFLCSSYVWNNGERYMTENYDPLSKLMIDSRNKVWFFH